MEIIPTHKCKICGSLWRLLPEGIWNLCQPTCGKCCDNEPMGDQIAPICQDCGGIGYIQPSDSDGSTPVLQCGVCMESGILPSSDSEILNTRVTKITTTQIDHREWKEWRDESDHGAIGLLNALLMPHGVTVEVLNGPENDYLNLRAVSFPTIQDHGLRPGKEQR